MDVTAILDESGNQLFATATILKASTTPSTTYAQHVLEDGTVVSDNAVENQTRISMALILDSNDYQQVYKTIKNAKANRTKLTVQTRVDSYPNMYIEAMPSEESAGLFDTVQVIVDFIEQQFGEVVTQQLAADDVANPADVDTFSRGEQLPKEDTGTTLQKIAGLFG